MNHVTLGHSVEGRPLMAQHRRGRGPSLVVFGGIHGDEPESAALCERFVAALTPSAPDDSDVWVLCAANPDGLVRRSKDNANGVDLNRNFAASNFTVAHPPGYFPGRAPLSEPESQALVRLLDEAQPHLVVSVHQPFRCVNWDGPADAVAAAMSAASGYPALPSVGYPTPGSFGSFWGIDRGQPVITLELPQKLDDSDWRGCLLALDCALASVRLLSRILGTP